MAGDPTAGDEVPLDENTHYVAAIIAALRKKGDGLAVRWDGVAVTADALADSIVDTTASLGALGVGKGSTLGVLTEAMSPLALVARYAGHLLGATIVHMRTAIPSPTAPPIPLDAQASIIHRAGVDLLLVDGPSAERGVRIVDLVHGRAELAPPSTFGALTGDGGRADELPKFVRVPDPAVVTFTSGSTGKPKGVAEGFAGLNARILEGYPMLGNVPPVFLATAPVSHADGPFMDVALHSGGVVVLPAVVDATTMLRTIEEEKVTGTSMSVPELYAILDHPDLPVTDISSMAHLLYTGYPASPERLAEAVKYFSTALLQGYGTTESGPLTVLLPLEHSDPALAATVGRPMPGVRLSVRDPETGVVELPTGETGEVCAQSPIMMTGYLDDPELTAEVLRDGWLRTGDLGHLDEAGYLHLVGRMNDVIKVKATKIHPVVVEKALLTHHDVANAAVYGVPDADGLERVHASVSLRPGATCAAADLRAHVAKTLPETQAPVRFALRPVLPRTATGRKLDRPRMRREDADMPELG